MAVGVAIIRGIARTGTRNLGNFWVDLTRTVTRILVPISVVYSLALVSQGVTQNFKGSDSAPPLDRLTGVASQSIPGGPVGSQLAIKQLGTNGGGFFNTNSAHPFENPNGIANILETFSILLIPFAFVVAFGYIVKDKRQSRLLIAAMAGILTLTTAWAMFAEQNGNPALPEMNVDQSISTSQSGGNMEGKELRLGAAACGLWAGSTTNTANGSVNCMHDSFTSIGGASPMLAMMFGEVSPGGTGVGLMGMLIYALLAVFIAGLMVGRTPEYLGKKVQATEMKLLTLYILAMPIALLGFAAASSLLRSANTGHRAFVGDDQTEVRLTPIEWGMVGYLVRHPGRLVTYRQLVTEVWGPTYDPDQNLLRVHMAHIRRKLELNPSRPRYFITDSGMGYRYQA